MGLWEVFRRVEIQDMPALEYKMPYEDHVDPDPEISEMHNVVCNLKIRPHNKDWPQHQVLESVWKLLEECWCSNPSSRLTALRIKKNLSTIHDNFNRSSNGINQIV